MSLARVATKNLLDRARRGDREALSILAEAHWPAMRRWAYIELGERTLAEDASQDALVRLVRFIAGYDPSRPFDAWLRSLVRNAARDLRSRRARDASREQHPVEVGTHCNVDQRLDLQKKASEAVRAFASLPDRQRQIVELVDALGHSPSEVASELGLAPGTVRSQLFAARRTLRRRLLAGGGEVVALLREP